MHCVALVFAVLCNDSHTQHSALKNNNDNGNNCNKNNSDNNLL